MPERIFLARLWKIGMKPPAGSAGRPQSTFLLVSRVFADHAGVEPRDCIPQSRLTPSTPAPGGSGVEGGYACPLLTFPFNGVSH